MYPGSASPAIEPHRLFDPERVPGDPTDHRLPHRDPTWDAPSHMLARGSTLEVLPASQFCGRAVVLDVSDLPPRSIITADHLRALNGTIRSADFVLFYTGWEKKWGTDAYYDDDFPVPDREAAQYLVSCGPQGRGHRRPQCGHPAGRGIRRPQDPAGGRAGDPGEPVPEEGGGPAGPDALRPAPEI